VAAQKHLKLAPFGSVPSFVISLIGLNFRFYEKIITGERRMVLLRILPAAALLAMVIVLSTGSVTNASDFETSVNKGNAAFDQGNHAEAIGYYQHALELQPNDANVLTDVAVSYRSMGQSNKAIQSLEKALRIYPEHEVAMYNLGIIYFYDLNDKEKAAQIWNKFMRVSKNNAVVSQVREILKTGQARSEDAEIADEAKRAYQVGDYAEAAKRFRLAADKGNADAQYWLELMYHYGSNRIPDEDRGGLFSGLDEPDTTGEVISKDRKMAVKYYKLAADQGHPGALYALGGSLAHPIWRTKGAEDYYILAADKGHIDAQFALGMLYNNQMLVNGKKIGPDFKKAVKYLELAMNNGSARAPYELGYLYLNN
jgi:TPR repeat protein